MLTFYNFASLRTTDERTFVTRVRTHVSYALSFFFAVTFHQTM
jgi:hypothetical protein